MLRCKKLIARGEDVNEALHYAIGRGRLEIVSLFLQVGQLLRPVLISALPTHLCVRGDQTYAAAGHRRTQIMALPQNAVPVHAALFGPILPAVL